MFGQVLACMLYVYYIVVRFCIPTYENLNQNDITLPIFISVLFNSIMPGSLFLLLGFYGFLHCWLNAFAEMLRFADRMFYKVRTNERERVRGGRSISFRIGGHRHHLLRTIEHGMLLFMIGCIPMFIERSIW